MVDSRSWRRRCSPPSALRPCARRSRAAAGFFAPPSEVSVGAGYVFEDNQRFGQFNGLTDKGWYGLFDFNLIKRFDDTGWLKFDGRNVGLDNRALRLSVEQQGNWRFFLDFNQIPNFIPFTVTTGLAGIGSANQTINGTAPASYDLDTKRKNWTARLRQGAAGRLRSAGELSEPEQGGIAALGPGGLRRPARWRLSTS